MRLFFILIYVFFSTAIIAQEPAKSITNMEAAEKEIKAFVTYINLTYSSYQQEYVKFLERKNCMITENYGGYSIFNDMLISLKDDYANFSNRVFTKFAVNDVDSVIVDSLLNEIKSVWIPNFKTISKVIEALNENKKASLINLSTQGKSDILTVSQKNYKKFLKRLSNEWISHSRKFDRYNMRYNFFAAYLNMSL
ncbi:MAG: hypothetical protein ACM34K_21195 [Bacillota bacterium]